MKRAYIRDENKKFISIGWYCPECRNFVKDNLSEAQQRSFDAENIPDETEDNPCEGCSHWELCPGIIGDKYCKAHRSIGSTCSG